MPNCSTKRIEFEKRRGRKLKDLKIPIAPKRKRRGRSGGGGEECSGKKIEKLALQPDILKGVLKTI
jgi:hypothetical protein